MAISLCLVMEGYDTALLGAAIATPAFRKKFGHYAGAAKGYQLKPAWQAALGQGPTVGAFCGIFIASYCQDRWGYRRTIQCGLVAMTAFIFVVFFAPTIEIFFLGGLLCGLPWGAFSSSAVAYASEITPIKLRGYLTTYVSLCWIIGQFISAAVVLEVTNKRQDEWAYKIPFAIQWVWPIPIFILVTLAPESPWFLVRKGRLGDAEKAVSRLSSGTERASPAETVAMMVRTNKIEEDSHESVSYLECFKGANLRRTEITTVAWACTVWAGASFANHPEYFFVQGELPRRNAAAHT
ncbi:hypothetical protein VHUM_03632 [Vanrija humicola]|uniref:Major facilitator superfamily (MFS) profile domain-containing protein n=1 Tax=Vanrija humicola TaxID=5417 RepID=A0A7D8UZU1_VANHU|nr:hypothetical protein VHUM_03632 [Vanrija humicola]